MNPNNSVRTIMTPAPREVKKKSKPGMLTLMLPLLKLFVLISDTNKMSILCFCIRLTMCGILREIPRTFIWANLIITAIINLFFGCEEVFVGNVYLEAFRWRLVMEICWIRVWNGFQRRWWLLLIRVAVIVNLTLAPLHRVPPLLR